jgi:hypothetical protein
VLDTLQTLMLAHDAMGTLWTVLDNNSKGCLDGFFEGIRSVNTGAMSDHRLIDSECSTDNIEWEHLLNFFLDDYEQVFCENTDSYDKHILQCVEIPGLSYEYSLVIRMSYNMEGFEQVDVDIPALLSDRFLIGQSCLYSLFQHLQLYLLPELSKTPLASDTATMYCREPFSKFQITCVVQTSRRSLFTMRNCAF